MSTKEDLNKLYQEHSQLVLKAVAGAMAISYDTLEGIFDTIYAKAKTDAEQQLLAESRVEVARELLSVVGGAMDTVDHYGGDSETAMVHAGASIARTQRLDLHDVLGGMANLVIEWDKHHPKRKLINRVKRERKNGE